MKKGRLHRPFVVVEPTMQAHPAVAPEQKLPPVDGKPVLPVDRYEARVLQAATTFRVFVPRSGGRPVEREGPICREEALAWVGQPALVYAVTPDGRSCCVTQRTVKVHRLIYGGEST